MQSASSNLEKLKPVNANVDNLHHPCKTKFHYEYKNVNKKIYDNAG